MSRFRIHADHSNTPVALEVEDPLALGLVLVYMTDTQDLELIKHDWEIARSDDGDAWEVWNGVTDLVLRFPDDMDQPVKPLMWRKCPGCEIPYNPQLSECEQYCQKCAQDTDSECNCGECKNKCHCSGGCPCCLGPFDNPALNVCWSKPVRRDDLPNL